MSNVSMEALELALFSSRVNAICEEMGATLQRSAFSPNIRDRLDYSCAVFDAGGQICAQAAHIPVHLGSMAYAMADVIGQMDWQAGDMVIFNDPYCGGTHLPDVTMVMPVFVDEELTAFVANRAHHADIGAESAGSMPLSSSLAEEGLVIAPQFWMRAGQPERVFQQAILSALSNPQAGQGDFSAQVAANLRGATRLAEWVSTQGCEIFSRQVKAMNAYATELARKTIAKIPEGEYVFTDVMDDDGQGNTHLPIRLTLTISGGQVMADFAGTASQVAGNINCPISVTAAAILYVFRCLMPEKTPVCAGTFSAIQIKAPEGSLVNAIPSAAVAAGNVETSSRIVDVILGALSQAIPEEIPAASQGTMNNLAMGSREGDSAWDYYETIGGGMGAGPSGGGLSGVQTHMTNTLNTPIEVLESHYPLRITQYALRENSGGEGCMRGGEGLIREYYFLRTAEITLLSERRAVPPWGLMGGMNGRVGGNYINDKLLNSKENIVVSSGDSLKVITPGGGAWGQVAEGSSHKS